MNNSVRLKAGSAERQRDGLNSSTGTAGSSLEVPKTDARSHSKGTLLPRAGPDAKDQLAEMQKAELKKKAKIILDSIIRIQAFARMIVAKNRYVELQCV